jgi:ATP-dependent DNA helicase DinG
MLCELLIASAESSSQLEISHPPVLQVAQMARNPFFFYQIPEAIIQVKQGGGHLFRSSRYRGVIAVFDVRLHTQSFDQLFLRSLPPCRVVYDKKMIGTFFC